MAKRYALWVSLIALVAQSVNAQTSEGPDFFQSIGKMYVVVGVITLIFIGIVFFLIYLDRKLTKLEKQMGQ